MTFRPRIRTIKPEMWADEKVGQLSRDARLLFVGLITMADDEGRLRGMPAAILGHVFPYDVDALRKLDGWLAELVASDLVVSYMHGGITYFYLPGFTKHQVINKPKDSTLPVPDRAAERTPTVVVTDQSGTATGSVRASRARGGTDLERNGKEQEQAATPQRSRADTVSRSLAETVQCPRCRVAAGEKCDGVRGKRESAHLERHHAVGELLDRGGYAAGKPAAGRGATSHTYRPDADMVAMRDSFFPGEEVGTLESAAFTLRGRRQEVTPESIAAFLTAARSDAA